MGELRLDITKYSPKLPVITSPILWASGAEVAQILGSVQLFLGTGKNGHGKQTCFVAP